MNDSLESTFYGLTTANGNLSSATFYPSSAKFDDMSIETDGTASMPIGNLTTILLRNEQYILWVLNEKLYNNRFLPATIYIGICAVLGTAGNGIVVCVYNTKRKRNTANVSIFVLGIVDLLLCAIVMPFKLFDMRYPLMYGIAPVCTCYHFLEITLSMVAVALMICIAVDRYLIIARPLNRMHISRTYKILGVCVAIGIAASWPTVFIYGESTIKTRLPEVSGTTCGVTDVVKGTAIPQVWYLYLYAVFVITLIVIVCMYTKIWLMIRNWKNTLIGESATRIAPRIRRPFNRRSLEPIPFGTDNKDITMNSFLPLHMITPRVRRLSFEDEIICLRDISSTADEGISSNSSSTRSRESTDSRAQSKFRFLRLFPGKHRRSSAGASSIESYSRKRARMRRNTIVFGVISILFVLSYLPCLVIIGLRTLELYNVTKVNQMNARVAEVFIRSGYMHSVFNPFVYSFLCPNFRNGVYRLLFR